MRGSSERSRQSRQNERLLILKYLGTFSNENSVPLGNPTRRGGAGCGCGSQVACDQLVLGFLFL